MDSPPVDLPSDVASIEIKPYTSIHELDSVNDEPEVAEIEADEGLDETAPNWAFASFVAERDELLHLFKTLNPSEHSSRLIFIVCL
jgi:hypothetical protein